jgi:hypothetical protein
MLQRKSWFGTAVISVLAVVAGALFAQPGAEEKKEGATPGVQKPAFSPAEMQAMMEEWMRVAKPGEKHKLFKELEGKWTTTSRMWMGGPGSPTVETTGTAENKVVLDGRYLLQEFKGEFMMPGADGQMMKQPHHGIGLTGHDNYRNQFVGCWGDNLGTAMLTMRGLLDPSGKVLTMYGEMDEPGLKMVGRMVKYETMIVNKDKHVFTIYDLAVGPEYKVIEVTYERQ